MRKNSKKILGSALAIMLATTSVCSGMPALKAQSVEYVQEVAQNNVEGKIVLHAKGTGLKIYAWSGTGPLFGAWPGAAMDADATMGDGWCYKVCRWKIFRNQSKWWKQNSGTNAKWRSNTNRYTKANRNTSSKGYCN